jgi:predicted SAM-dependent methyltransferase
MIRQGWKDLWYRVWSPVLHINLYRHRLTERRNGTDLKVNIGCGKAQFAGWVNVDGNFLHRPDMWLDVRQGLPFRSKTVAVIYASHFFEHLYLHELRLLLAECRRVLREGGVLRIAVPNLRSAIEAYYRGDRDWFSSFPAEFHTLGGRFFNEMLCGDQHRLMFDFDFLAEVLRDAGFRAVYQVQRGESRVLQDGDELFPHELGGRGKSPDPWLLVEAIRQDVPPDGIEKTFADTV